MTPSVTPRATATRRAAAAVALACVALAAPGRVVAEGRAAPVAGAPPEARPARVTGERWHGRGRLRLVEDVPFLTLAGTYFEMGEQYGALMKDRIAPLLRAMPRRPGGQDRRRIELRLSPRFRELLRGVAVGLGVTNDELLRFVLEQPREQGATVLARVGAGGRGVLLHGKNVDLSGWPSGGAHAVVELRPTGELRLLVTTDLAIADGMNERGITVSVTAGPACQSSSSTIPPPSAPAAELSGMVLDLLATASSLADVDRAVGQLDEDAAAIVAAGSAQEGDGAVHDLSCGTRRKTPLPATGHLAVTSCHLHPDLTPPRALRDCPRYHLLEERLGRERIEGLDGLAAVLGDAGLGHGVNNVSTRRSEMYDARTGLLRLAVQGGYAAWGRWIEYQWRRDRASVQAEPLYDLGEVALRTRPAEKVASVRAVLRDEAEQASLWAEIDDALGRTELVRASAGYVVFHGRFGPQVDLEVVQPVLSFPDSGSVTFRWTEPIELASVRHYGPHRTLAAAYQALAAWMEEHGYAASGPVRETYLRDVANQPDPRKWETQVEIPVSLITRIPEDGRPGP